VEAVMLGRVCNVPPGKGNNEDVTVDVTEYTHLLLPQGGQASSGSGFLGCFEPCINLRYDPSQAGSTKFQRHYGLPRADLLLLDVQTFTAGKKLYVQVDLLRLLERAFPGFKLPAQLPELHRRNGNGGAGRKGRPEVADGGDSSDSAANDGEGHHAGGSAGGVGVHGHSCGDGGGSIVCKRGSCSCFCFCFCCLETACVS
jgi:hypothetical protein